MFATATIGSIVGIKKDNLIKAVAGNLELTSSAITIAKIIAIGIVPIA
jgi:hypothetical protein